MVCSTGKFTLCHNILITQQQQQICLHGKLFIRDGEQGERLPMVFMGVQGAGPWWWLQGAMSLCLEENFVFGELKMHNLVPFLPTFLSKFIKNKYVFWWLGCDPLAKKLCNIDL